MWTWAGLKANATLRAGLGLDSLGVENDYLDLPAGADLAVALPDRVPDPGRDAITGLKFSVALPAHLASRTVGERLADPKGAELTIAKPRVVVRTEDA
ncbi:MAG: hypothetical protein QM595_14155 [Nocardioides sp.]